MGFHLSRKDAKNISLAFLVSMMEDSASLEKVTDVRQLKEQEMCTKDVLHLEI